MINAYTPVRSSRPNFKFYSNMTTKRDEHGNYATIRLEKSDLKNKLAKKWGFDKFNYTSKPGAVLYPSCHIMKEFMKDLNEIMPHGVSYNPEIPDTEYKDGVFTSYKILSNKDASQLQVIKYNHNDDTELIGKEQILNITA